MITKRADDWTGSVKIIGLSIDSANKTMADHVEKKGWGNVEHYWRSTSTCSEVYSV
jgi:hypothetical protein